MAKKQHFAVMPKPFWYDPLTGLQHEKKENDRCEYFASTAEFHLWMHLSGKLKECRIVRQFGLLYKPPTPTYPASFWKVDFCITFRQQVSWLLEVKGDWIMFDTYALAEFQHKLQALELHNRRSWEKLVIVGSENLKIDSNIKIWSLEETIAYLVHWNNEAIKNDSK